MAVACLKRIEHHFQLNRMSSFQKEIGLLVRVRTVRERLPS